MKNYKETTSSILYIASSVWDYSEKSIAIWDGDAGIHVLYPKSKIVVNHDAKLFGVTSDAYKSALDFTESNFTRAYLRKAVEGKKTFTYNDCK